GAVILAPRRGLTAEVRCARRVARAVRVVRTASDMVTVGQDRCALGSEWAAARADLAPGGDRARSSEPRSRCRDHQSAVRYADAEPARRYRSCADCGPAAREPAAVSVGAAAGDATAD